MSDDYEHDRGETADPVEQWGTLETRVRPRWPKVIGVISIVWGALGLLCGGLGLVSIPLTPQFISQALPNDEPIPYGMVPTATDYTIAVVSFLLAALLLFAGITCVTHRPITRHMHLVYGLGSIPITVWSYLNQTQKNELNMQWAKEFPDNELAKGFDMTSSAVGVGQILGLVLLLVLGIGVPLFYLIWFGLVKTKPEQITGGDEGVY